MKLDDSHHIFQITLHHIICDGWSIGLLIDELASLYKAFSTGSPSSLQEIHIHYTDFAQWQQAALGGPAIDSQLNYWKEKLAAPLAVLDLPTDRPRPPVQSFKGARLSFNLSKELSDSLNLLSRQLSATLFMTMLAAFKLLLGRYTNQKEIIVGTPIAGRRDSKVEGLIGMFLNTLVLRTEMGGGESFGELVGKVRGTTLEGYANQDVPFEKLLEELRPQRDLSRSPFFQVFFNMLNFPSYQIQLPGLTAERFSPPATSSNFDLTIYVDDRIEGIHLNLVYNTDLFTEERMSEMLMQLERVLSQAVEDPYKKLAQFSLLTTAAERVLPDPAEPLDSSWVGAVHALFSRQAQLTPDHIAISGPDEVWTYRELDERANELAHFLRAGGIVSEDVVAIYAHRSGPLVWAVLGVLKAGAAFLILDSAYPAQRLVDYLDIARPRGWLQIRASGEPPEAVREFLATLSCPCSAELPAKQDLSISNPFESFPASDPCAQIMPDDLACVTFTSGSTGRPKGIMGRHGSMSHFLPWIIETFGLNESDSFSMLSGLSHDPIHRDIFTPLSLGGTIVIPDPEKITAPGWLAEWMRREEIKITNLTPAMVQILTQPLDEIDRPACEVRSLRYAFTVGDVLTRRDVSRLRRVAPSITCINLYGATETQRAVGHYIIPDPCEDASNGLQKESIPLGRGIKGVQLLIFNPSQQLAGIGELGEIYLRSSHLARGYMGDESLTRERFLLNPFTREAGDKLYRTGDLGRYLPDGNAVFVGRSDTQVKIRGFRIELGEIESTLRAHQSVRDAVVVAREASSGDRRLAAYVVLHANRSSLSGELRSFLKQRLPEYMVPASFMMLDRLPVTPNGKVERRALPEPQWDDSSRQKAASAPRTPVEDVIANIWAEVFGVTRVGIHDNFFEIGGHSLLGIQLISRVRAEFGIELSLRRLFESPTVASMAEQVEMALGADLDLIEHLSDEEIQAELNKRALSKTPN